MSKIQEAKKLLKQYFGYDEFRQGQEQLIEAALNGQDVLGIMPTGAGKSLQLGSVHLALGGKYSPDMHRNGTKSGLV